MITTKWTCMGNPSTFLYIWFWIQSSRKNNSLTKWNTMTHKAFFPVVHVHYVYYRVMSLVCYCMKYWLVHKQTQYFTAIFLPLVCLSVSRSASLFSPQNSELTYHTAYQHVKSHRTSTLLPNTLCMYVLVSGSSLHGTIPANLWNLTHNRGWRVTSIGTCINMYIHSGLHGEKTICAPFLKSMAFTTHNAARYYPLYMPQVVQNR